MPETESPPPACRHARIQVVARQQGAEFFECLDCHRILDGDDISSGVEESETEADTDLDKL